MWDLIVSVPDHCLSFYFVCSSQVLTDDIITTFMKPPRHTHDLQPLHFSSDFK